MASALSIAKDVHRFIRADDNDPGTQPTAWTTSGGTLNDDICNFVVDAWVEIQRMKKSWRWMRAQGTFPTVNGQRVYTRTQIQSAIPRYDQLRYISQGRQRYVIGYTAALGVSDSTRINFYPYEIWRGQFDWSTRPTGKPTNFTVRPQGEIEFDGTPNGIYTISIDYRLTPQILAAASDIPEMPVEYHDLITWTAVDIYCRTRQQADTLAIRARKEIDDRLATLTAREIEEPLFF